MAAVLICVGACAGALWRWQLGGWLNGGAWAWGTLAVNWLGSLLMGIFLTLNWHDSCRLLLITGFLGSFTTFSAFSAEVVQQILRGQYAAAMIWAGLQILGGLGWTAVGIYAGKHWLQAA